MKNSIDFQENIADLLTDYADDPQIRTALIDLLYRLEAVETLINRPEQQDDTFMNFYRAALKNLRFAVDDCPEI